MVCKKPGVWGKGPHYGEKLATAASAGGPNAHLTVTGSRSGLAGQGACGKRALANTARAPRANLVKVALHQACS